MKNHSCTHLLHRALREVLGTHVHQAGSLVTPDHLRFDFTHFESISKEDLQRIEARVNAMIAMAADVSVEEMSMEESKERGAIGLFEDKYQDIVRVVSMGDFSVELCGGTHVSNTSEIQMMKIISEGSVASGVRRIEAITGRKVYQSIVDTDKRLENIAEIVGAKDGMIEQRIEALQSNLDEMKAKMNELKKSRDKDLLGEVLEMKQDIQGINVIAAALEDVDVATLRDLQDRIKDRLESCVLVFGSKLGDKLVFSAAVSKDLTKRKLHAGKIIQQVTKIAGGNGGGRPDMATGGGKDVDCLDEAIEHVASIVQEMLA